VAGPVGLESPTDVRFFLAGVILQGSVSVMARKKPERTTYSETAGPARL
jgi:hypothetical protein